MSKAVTACASARVLLDRGDIDGAANRACYARFDAARAAILASGSPVEADVGRSHSGLIGAFGNCLVKNGPVSKEMGRLLNRSMHGSPPSRVRFAGMGLLSIALFGVGIWVAFEVVGAG